MEGRLQRRAGAFFYSLMIKKAVLISLSPNTSWRDAGRAKLFLLAPWRWSGWRTGEWIKKLEQAIKEKLGFKHAISFAAGRQALWAILNSLDLKEGDEVITQAFTGVVVPNAIRWANGQPKFVDIDLKRFNLNLNSLEKHITNRTRAIIIQHTFGQVVNMDQVLAIAKKHRLFVIEDCAHALGAKWLDRYVGTIGDAAIFSFGRDKIISSVAGGIAVTNNDELAKKLHERQNQSPLVSRRQVCQNLMHPIVMTLAVPTFFFLALGKFIIWFSQKTHLINKVYTVTEKQGQPPKYLTQKMPNAMAYLACHQLKQLDAFNRRRQQWAKLYRQELSNLNQLTLPTGLDGATDVFLRYNILTSNPNKLIRQCLKKGIMLGNWYQSVITPPIGDNRLLNYQTDQCPMAEIATSQSVNLPTHPRLTKKDALKIVAVIKYATLH